MMALVKKYTDHKLVRVALVVIVLAVAVFFRTYQLDAMPPGLYHDEAVNGIDILDVLQGHFPVFFERNNGREPLFIYLQAISVYFSGNNPLAIREVAVLMGVLTVLATFFLAKEWFGYWVGLLSMAEIAVALWHVDLSRVGLRAIATPLFLILSLLFLWKALQFDRRRDFALAGVMIGLNLYTYISARLAIPVIALILLVQLIADRQSLLQKWRNIALFIVVAIIIFAPLGVYFAGHPDAFFGRIDQVSVFTEKPAIETEPMTFEQTLLGGLKMFFVAGDINWRHNLSGRPVFDPVSGALFVLGLLWTFANIRRRHDQLPMVRADLSSQPEQNGRLLPLFWLMLWFLLMLVPSIVAQDSPNFLRLTALAPATFIFAALGFYVAWGWVHRRVGQSASAAFAVVLALLVSYQGVATFNDYFNVEARQPKEYWFFDTNLVDATRFLPQLDGGKSAYPSIFFYVNREPTVRFLAPRYYNGNWLPEDTNVINLPSDADRDAYYLLAPTSYDGLMPRQFPDIPIYLQPLAPDGTPAFTVYRVPATRIKELQTPQELLNVTYGNQVELVGFSNNNGRSSAFKAGDNADVSLLWRMTDDTRSSYSFFAHLVDEKGRIWAQQDLIGSKTFGWHKGDLIYSRHKLTVPADMPEIPVRIVAGVMVKSTGERLRPTTNDPTNVVKLFDVNVKREGPPLAVSTNRLSQPIGKELIPGLEVVGAELGVSKLKVGNSLNVGVEWSLKAHIAKDPIVETRITDGKDNIYARQEGPPGYGHFPFSKWRDGDMIYDPRSVSLVGQVPASSARVTLAALDPDTKLQLGEVDLGSISIEDRPRNFALPSPQHPVDINFAGQIRLLGFDIAPDSVAPGGDAKLTLYWQAISTPAENYTVFTHLLDDRNIVVGQKDNPPVQGSYPTLGWVPQEIVKDEYKVTLKERASGGELRLEIGLYEPVSGKRLKVEDSNEDSVIVGKIKVQD